MYQLPGEELKSHWTVSHMQPEGWLCSLARSVMCLLVERRALCLFYNLRVKERWSLRKKTKGLNIEDWLEITHHGASIRRSNICDLCALDSSAEDGIK